MRNCLLTLILLLSSQFQVFSQIDFHHTFHNLSSKNGLPSSEVYMVRQDSKGITWICSDGGVTKYDGHLLKSFTTLDGLTDNVVFDFYEDYKGRIWFLTYNSELCYYDGSNIIQYQYNHLIKEIPNTSSSNSKQLYIDKSESIYYSIHQAGFIQINAQGKLIYRGNNRNSIEFIYDKDHVFPSFASFKDAPSAIPVNLFKDGREINVGYFESYVKRLKMIEGSKGTIAILNNRLIEIETFQTLFIGDNLNNAVQINDTTIWVSTSDGAIKLHKNGNHFMITKKVLKDQFVSSVNFDSNGGIWISSLTGGVFYTPDLSVEYASVKDGLQSNDIREVLYHDSTLYIGYNKSWQVFSQNKNSNTSIDSPILSPKFGVLGNQVVIAGNPSLTVNQYTSNENEINIRPFRSMEIHKNKIFGALDRIYSVELKNGRFIQDTLINKINNVFSDSRQVFNTVCYSEEGILVGGKNGLFKLKDEQLVPYLHGENNEVISVKQIMQTKHWGIAVATYNMGLVLLENGRVRKKYNAKQGLLSNQIKCIYESNEGNLLIGTNYGLSSISRVNDYVGRISTENGLLGGNINAISENDKFIFLGTINGLYRIDKKFLKESADKNSKTIVLESVMMDNLNASILSKDVYFNYGTSNMKILFRTTNYSNWMNKLYEYRLSPSDNWIKIYSPEISIPRPKGDYDIQVRYKLGEGNWSKPIHLVSLHEIVPFWAEPIFWIFILFLIFVGVLFVIRRVYKGREEKLIIENRVSSLQQRLERVRLNPHFIFNVLNSIHGFVLFNERDKAEKYLLKFSSVMRSFLTKSKEGSISITEEIDILKGYLELETIRFEKKISLRFSGDINSKLLIPSMIVQPAAENAVKHGLIMEENDLQIEISVKIKPDYVLVKVVNSGLMSKENIVKFEAIDDFHATGINHKRLAYYRKIFKNQYFGMKAVNDEPNNRTEIRIQLPNLNNYENSNS